MKSEVSNLVRDAFMITLLIVFAQITITLPSVVPITLQTLAIYLIACFLPPKHAFFSALGYLIMGAIGLPVFGHFSGGMGVLFGPAGGFLFSFPLMAYIMSLIITHERDLKGHIFAMILGTILCYAIGSLYFMFMMKATLKTTLITCVIPFLPGDALKIGLSCMLAEKLEKIVLRKTILS